MEEKYLKDKEIENYVLSVLIQKIDSNQYISNVFGTNFAKETLPKNVSQILFNHTKDTHAAGDFSIVNGTIRYFKKENAPEVKSKEDFISNPSVVSVLLHESIHALFWDKDASYINDNNEEVHPEKKQTGLQIYYSNGNIFNNGLNEGFTEWVRKVIEGTDSESYVNHRKAIELIAVKHGITKTLSLVKGRPLDNLPKLLGFGSRTKLVEYLENSDNVLDKQRELEDIHRVKARLEKREKECNDAGKAFDFKGFSNEMGLNRVAIANYRRSKGWVKYDELTIDELKEYINDSIETAQKEHDEALKVFERDTFNRLFGSLAKKVEESRKPSPFDLKKLVEAYNLLSTAGLKEKVKTLITDKLGVKDSDISMILMDTISRNPDLLLTISNYDLIKTKGTSYDEVILLPKDGSNKVINLKRPTDTVDATNLETIKKENGNGLIFDYTEELDFDGNYSKTIQQYEIYRQALLGKDPNAKIYISNRAIIFKSKVIGDTFYMIEGNHIEEDKNPERVDTNFENLKSDLPKKENLFDRLKRRVSSMFRTESREQYYEYYQEDEHEKYVESLKQNITTDDMKDKDTIEEGKEHQKTEEKDKEEDR